VAAAGLFFALLSLWLRVAWLQLARHAYYTERAERNQEQRVLVNPVRGDLLDRYGRRLATDVVTYSLSAVPREMADVTHTARDLAALLKLEPRLLEREFVARPRYLMIQRHLPPEVAQRISDWQRRGLYLSVETERAYPLGAVAEELVGRTDVDHNGVEGIELALDGELRGQPGWITQFRNGRGGVFALPRGLKRSPTDGRDVTLTIDADLQSIVEGHLARAADTLNAERAFAIFLDPSSGEILAAVSVPHRANGQGRNWPFTDQYEPGSTFKVVTAAAALEDNVVAPDEYFDAGNGTCQIVPGTFFHDTHRRAGLTFRDAMRYSSNIVMGKIALKVGPERLYREATSFGFGSLTGIQFPGETAGRLRSPEHWSGRSCPTIAIGHEVTVTPLQLALGYAAIANGGVLMQPRLVREVRDARGNLVRRESAQALHRVFSEGTAHMLCAMLQSVVDSGTATPARIADFPIAGKTGTAQKWDADNHSYTRGMYMSSFAGFAPADHPDLVGVIVIDNPRGKHYYGGEVAAPVFRAVIQDLRRSPHSPFAPVNEQWVQAPPRPAPVSVPDLHLLPPRDAERRLEECGLRARLAGAGERVLSQTPASGEAVERGESVTLWLSAPDDSLGHRMPDLTGLAVREALRRLTVLEVVPRLDGHGVVLRQFPPPGTPLERRARCDLWCGAETAGGAQRTGNGLVATAAAGAGGRP